MKGKKAISLLLVSTVALALLAGCSGNDDVSSIDPGSTVSPTGSAVSDAGATNNSVEINANDPQAASASVIRDVVRMGVSADVTNWAPWANGSVARNTALWGIYQPLADYQDGKYIPVLLKSYSVSEDSTEVYCELWPDIQDSAGNPFTADDAIFSAEKIIEFYPQNATMIESLEKVDELNFTFHLRRPLQVAELKALFTQFCVTQEAYEASGDKMASYPVGTGPYVLDSQESGYKFTYKTNDNYWATEESIQQARDMQNVKTIEWYVISENAQRTIALQQGTIDICDSISAEDQPKFNNTGGYHLYNYPNNLSMKLFPNCDESSVCHDVNLRRAICYAISNEAVLNGVYNGNGTAMYAESPAWASDYVAEWASQDNYYHDDIAKAVEYLGKSNYNNETLKIICSTDTASTTTAQLVLSFLNAINIKSEIKSYESATFDEYIQDPTQWDIMIRTRPCSAGVFSQEMQSDMFSSNTSWGGSINFIFDSHLDELIETAMTMSTSTPENLTELHNYIVDNAYMKGLCNYNSTIVVPDWVTDVCLSVRKTIVPGGCVYTQVN